MNLKIGEDTIHYLEFGQGEPLVLVPSLWVTSTSYKALGQELGKFFHVYIPDIFRGKSEFSFVATDIESYVAKLAEFIQGVQLKNYYLIGVSLSGIIASKYIRASSHNPKKAFLISTTVLPLRVNHERLTLMWGYIMLVYHNMFSREGRAKNRMWIGDGLDNARRHFRQAWTEGLIASSLHIENIRQLPVPTKLVFALRDEFIPKEAVDRLSKVKNLELEIIDGYHGWFFGREEELTEKIFQYFQ
jgi:pimeloyl-ACP methyl ester carboxylesterase